MSDINDQKNRIIGKIKRTSMKKSSAITPKQINNQPAQQTPRQSKKGCGCARKRRGG